MAATVQTTGVIVPAAGQGTRFGSGSNKVWAELNGMALLDQTLAKICSHPDISAVSLVSSAEDLQRMRAHAATFPKVVAVVVGGETRCASVRNGLMALPRACTAVLVHDAARPNISHALISRVLAATRQFGAAVPCMPVTDTIKRSTVDMLVDCTVPREGLWAAQTPQGAMRTVLEAAYEHLDEIACEHTDEASLIQASGAPVAIVQGEAANIKITLPDDLTVVSTSITEARQVSGTVQPCWEYRTGFGYDVHAIGQGRDLWLGGVHIPHPYGLLGHSDADVVIHAACDALLGAGSLGDIGRLFPDTDPTHRGRRSGGFLMEVCSLLRDKGWHPVHIDVALAAESPKITPYREAMREALAGFMEVSPDCVSVKATTSERLGFVGRGEGMACWAVATVRRLAT